MGGRAQRFLGAPRREPTGSGDARTVEVAFRRLLRRRAARSVRRDDGVLQRRDGDRACAAGRRGRLPDRVRFGDVATMALATHKIARLLTKDSVTSFLRAPFVRLQKKSGTNSLDETPRGGGLQRALGELLSCPECTGQWVAAGLLAGMLHSPRTTRAITSLYSALALGDLLQFVYTGLKSRA